MVCGRWQGSAGKACAGLAIVALWAGAARSQEAADPVAQLQAVLRDRSLDPANRDRGIQDCCRRLRGLADMQRALWLAEWREPEAADAVAAIDQANRAALAESFTRTGRQLLRGSDPAGAALAIETLAQMAAASRSIGERADVPRRLAPDLAALVIGGMPPLKAAAARALGQVEPDPAVAVPALEGLLRSSDAGLRRAAADGLVGLLQALLQTSAWSPAGVEAGAAPTRPLRRPRRWRRRRRKAWPMRT